MRVRSNVVDSIGRGLNLLGISVRDFNAKLFLHSHEELNSVK
jgi:hypothetical protein